MSLMLFLVLAAAAVVTAVPVVLLIPRVRTSPLFNGLLWVATPVSGFLVAWVAVAMAGQAQVLDNVILLDTPVLPAVGGALAGALAVNLPLWLLDLFDRDGEEELMEEEEPADEPEEGEAAVESEDAHADEKEKP